MNLRLVRSAIVALVCSLVLVHLGACDAGSGGDGAMLDGSQGADEGGFVGFGDDAATTFDAQATSDAGDAAEVAVCGDGIVQLGEVCDDGNSIPGDGCSGLCKTRV